MSKTYEERKELREKLRALPRTKNTDPRYPIDAYEDDLVALIEAELTEARKGEVLFMKGAVFENLNDRSAMQNLEINGTWILSTLEARLAELNKGKQS